jgi:hypothetical protein
VSIVNSIFVAQGSFNYYVTGNITAIVGTGIFMFRFR